MTGVFQEKASLQYRSLPSSFCRKLALFSQATRMLLESVLTLRLTTGLPPLIFTLNLDAKTNGYKLEGKFESYSLRHFLLPSQVASN